MKALSKAIERAWYHGTFWYGLLLIILWPLSCLFCGITVLRRYRLQATHTQLPVPVIIVGNINVGGTGKTPFLCALANALSIQGKRVGIISRGYGGAYDGKPRLLQATDQASLVGDEPLLIARTTRCPVVIAHDRYAAAQYLIQQASIDIILSDDGLQHYALPRTVEIVVLDGGRGVGNGLCLPAGPLREPVSRLEEVDFVVVNGSSSQLFHDDQLLVQLIPEQWTSVSAGDVLPLDTLKTGTQVHAVAGIGNPQRFFSTLRMLGLTVIEHEYPDHYAFTANDLQFADQLPVVMTEKDAVKCAEFAGVQCYALRVKMTLPEDWLSRLLARMDKNFRRNL